jgi:succinate dehydrogenase / fumarate reductase cytochrome b subunit
MVTKQAMFVTADGAKVCVQHPLQLHQPEPGCKCGKLRLPRKVHAITGFWLAVFVTVHLAICLTGINPRQYQGTVNLLHRWLGYLPGVVLLLVILPLLLQAASGLYLVVKEGMRYDIKRCNRGGKPRFFLQRFSGLAILAFLLFHVGSVYGWGSGFAHQETVARLLGGGLPEGNAFLYTASAFRPWTSPAANLLTIAVLLAGILGTAFHAANGALSGAILWKVVESSRGKSWFGYACAGGGIALAAMGMVAWHAFTLSPNVHAALVAIGH